MSKANQSDPFIVSLAEVSIRVNNWKIPKHLNRIDSSPFSYNWMKITWKNERFNFRSRKVGNSANRKRIELGKQPRDIIRGDWIMESVKWDEKRAGKQIESVLGGIIDIPGIWGFSLKDLIRFWKWLYKNHFGGLKLPSLMFDLHALPT